jgi:hypothetical protein
LASVSMRDAEEDVLRQEAKDAKKSMAQALVAYKSLLHQEVCRSNHPVLRCFSVEEKN